MLEDWILRKKEIEDSKDSLQGADLCNAKLMQAKLDCAKLEDADLIQLKKFVTVILLETKPFFYARSSRERSQKDIS